MESKELTFDKDELVWVRFHPKMFWEVRFYSHKDERGKHYVFKNQKTSKFLDSEEGKLLERYTQEYRNLQRLAPMPVYFTIKAKEIRKFSDSPFL